MCRQLSVKSIHEWVMTGSMKSLVFVSMLIILCLRYQYGVLSFKSEPFYYAVR